MKTDNWDYIWIWPIGSSVRFAIKRLHL